MAVFVLEGILMLKRKLTSNTGATLLLALIFFLLCALAGTVVLTAGSAASGRISGLAESEQEFYTVSSAAELVKEDIEGQGFHVYREDEGAPVYVELPRGAVSAVFEDAIKDVYAGDGQYKEVLTLTPKTEDVKKITGEITATFIMNSNYQITVFFSKSGEERYSCSLVFEAVMDKWSETHTRENEETKQEYTVVQEHTKVNWSGGLIEKAES